MAVSVRSAGSGLQQDERSMAGGMRAPSPPLASTPWGAHLQLAPLVIACSLELLAGAHTAGGGAVGAPAKDQGVGCVCACVQCVCVCVCACVCA